MPVRAYFWGLLLAYFLVFAGGVACVGLFAAARLHAVRYEGAKRALLEECRLTFELIKSDLNVPSKAELNQRLRDTQAVTGARITIINEDGSVLAETDANSEQMENHRLRPEIIAASIAGTGEAIRFSHTVSKEMLYLATRHDAPGLPRTYVRFAIPLQSLTQGLHRFDLDLGVLAVGTLLLGGGLCFWLAYRQSQPIVQLSRFASALAADDLSQRVHINDQGPIGTINRALNHIAESLQSTRNNAVNQQDELLAVLRSMNDGIIAVDRQQRVILVNPAAASLLKFSADQSAGRPLWESVREEAVLKAAASVLQSGKPETPSLSVDGRLVEIHVSPLLHRDVPEGLLLVARDRTSELRYQEMRKEFVANVSHELRTPVTLVKGFIETLRDGALTDPVKGPHYLATVEKHVDQLTNLVTDLLDLSRIESKPGLPKRTSVNVADLGTKVADLMRPAAEKRKQQLVLSAHVKVPMISADSDYIERAIANLVDNAIKYTPDGGRIELGVNTDDNRVIVSVTDNGIGIPREDQPRIFERFYRVDKSRSRDMGGTGLGLAIVKHVALAHGGSIELQSDLGKGSVFRLKLPV